MSHHALCQYPNCDATDAKKYVIFDRKEPNDHRRDYAWYCQYHASVVKQSLSKSSKAIKLVRE